MPPTIARTLPRFALVMAALLAVAAFPQSALFALDRVEISGGSHLNEDAILALAGIRRGDRLFAIDPSAAARRLRADPRIKAADVWVRPPRAITVRVVDRRPLVALVVGDRRAWLGDDLVAVHVLGQAGSLPEVVDRVGRSPWVRAGAPVASPGAAVAIAVLPAVPPALRAQLTRIEIAAGPDVTLGLQSGLQIRVGAPATAPDRLAQVPGILAALRARGIHPASLDLRYAGSVAVRVMPDIAPRAAPAAAPEAVPGGDVR